LTPRAASSPTSWRVVNGAKPSRVRSHAAIGPVRVDLAVHLARFERPGLTPQLAPLRQTGRRDRQRLCNHPVRLARVRPRQRPLPKILRIRSRHPSWPPPPAGSLNHIPRSLGIPIPPNRSTL
jgi:hypothetical protein